MDGVLLALRAMEAKSGPHFVYVLLTLAMVIATSASFPERRRNDALKYHADSSFVTVMETKATTQLPEDHFRRSGVIGTEVILDCPQQREQLIVWGAKFRNGSFCYLSYILWSNMSFSNCSKNVNWVSRPDQESAIHIKPLQISSEGIYECYIATSAGTFSHEHTLTVLVPPTVSLTYHDNNGTAECKAASGKPAARISWVPQGDYKTENETWPNGTETITSIYNTTSIKNKNVTCFIFHLAWNVPHVLHLSRGKKSEAISTLKILSGFARFFGILLLFLLTYLGTILLFKRMLSMGGTRPSIQQKMATS